MTQKVNKNIKLHCIQTIDELARIYRGKYDLDLTLQNWRFGQKERSDYCRKNSLSTFEASEIERVNFENNVDNEKLPLDFNYISSNYTASEEIKRCFDPSYLTGCDCVDDCLNESCSCPAHKFPYTSDGKIRLATSRPIYECNDSCKCDPQKCKNRTVQRGNSVELCVFRTADGRGWGLKANQAIQRKSYVIQYCGEIITNEEGDRRGTVYDARQQTYLFDLDFHTSKDGLFTIDAYKHANIARFINHSCDPNLEVHSVWTTTHDPRLPVIAFFAKRYIRKNEELTFDYRMAKEFIDLTCTASTTAGSPPWKRVLCACKAENCRKYLV